MDRTVEDNGAFEAASRQALLELLFVIDDMNDSEIIRMLSWAEGRSDFPGPSDTWIRIYAGTVRGKREEKKKK